MEHKTLDYSQGYSKIPNYIARRAGGLKPAEVGILLNLLSCTKLEKVSITSISRDMQTDIRVIKNLLSKLCEKGYSEIVLSVVKNYNSKD